MEKKVILFQDESGPLAMINFTDSELMRGVPMNKSCIPGILNEINKIIQLYNSYGDSSNNKERIVKALTKANICLAKEELEEFHKTYPRIDIVISKASTIWKFNITSDYMDYAIDTTEIIWVVDFEKEICDLNLLFEFFYKNGYLSMKKRLGDKMDMGDFKKCIQLPYDLGTVPFKKLPDLINRLFTCEQQVICYGDCVYSIEYFPEFTS